MLDEYKAFYEWLKQRYHVNEQCSMALIVDCDTIESPDGKTGFGCFEADTNCLYIVADAPGGAHSVFLVIAHEFKHFLQKANGEEYNEEDADKFANHLVAEWERCG